MTSPQADSQAILSLIEELRKTENVLAAIEHDQWIFWSKAVSNEVSPERRARWEKLWIPYAELTEEQKEQDREWARKVFAITNYSLLLALAEQCVKMEEALEFLAEQEKLGWNQTLRAQDALSSYRSAIAPFPPKAMTKPQSPAGEKKSGCCDAHVSCVGHRWNFRHPTQWEMLLCDECGNNLDTSYNPIP
jgi:hypothetical protein